MSEEQTPSMEPVTNTENAESVTDLSTEEKESLLIGEDMERQQDDLLAGKYKNAEELEKGYLELQEKLGSNETEEEEYEEEYEEGEEDLDILEELWEYEINNEYLAGLIEGFYNNFEDSREANQALEKHLISIDNQWTIQDEVDWWEENQQYSIKNWRDSEEYLQLMSDKSQNTLNPDPDFVISDSYPKNVLRKHCDSL